MTREAGRRSPLSVAVSIAAWFAYGFLVLPSLIIIPMSFSDKDEFVFPPQTLSFYLYEKYFSIELDGRDSRKLEGCCGDDHAIRGFRSRGSVCAHTNGVPRQEAFDRLLLSPIFVPVIVVALGLYLYLGSARLTATTFALSWAIPL